MAVARIAMTMTMTMTMTTVRCTLDTSAAHAPHIPAANLAASSCHVYIYAFVKCFVSFLF